MSEPTPEDREALAALLNAKWEYKQVSCNVHDVNHYEETELALAGREGWEAVAMGKEHDTMYVLLKRRVPT